MIFLEGKHDIFNFAHVIFQLCSLSDRDISTLLTFERDILYSQIACTFLSEIAISEIYGNFRPFLKWDIVNLGDDLVLFMVIIWFLGGDDFHLMAISACG